MSIKVRMVFHFEDGSWWADSEDVPGYYAGAGTLKELRERVREGLEFHLEEPVEISEELIEMVSTTRPEGHDDIEIEQRVRHHELVTLGSTELTVPAPWVIRRLPPPAVAPLPQPTTPHGKAMAGC